MSTGGSRYEKRVSQKENDRCGRASGNKSGRRWETRVRVTNFGFELIWSVLYMYSIYRPRLLNTSSSRPNQDAQQ